MDEDLMLKGLVLGILIGTGLGGWLLFLFLVVFNGR